MLDAQLEQRFAVQLQACFWGPVRRGAVHERHRCTAATRRASLPSSGAGRRQEAVVGGTGVSSEAARASRDGAGEDGAVCCTCSY